MTLLKRLSPTGSSFANRITDPRLKLLLETGKHPTRLLGEVQRHLLTSGSDSDRRIDVLHPSEIAHSNWCRRAAYYQLTGVQAPKTVLHWQTRMVFDEGKEIHHKWQNRLWAIGRLTGQFFCYYCGHVWWADSPDTCESCHADRAFLTYQEVPLRNESLRIAGHADGQDGNDAVIEIKSVGVGTLWFEAPDLLAEHTYKLNVNGKEREFIDHDELWDSIRKPFPSHIRQAHLYSYLGAPTDEIFIYESKWNQRVKEFVVKFDEERIADRILDCHIIGQALKEGKPPSCRRGGCPECQLYEESLKNAKPKRIIRRPTADRPTPTTPNGRRIQRTIRTVR